MTKCRCGVIVNMVLPFVTRETRHTATMCEPVGSLLSCKCRRYALTSPSHVLTMFGEEHTASRCLTADKLSDRELQEVAVAQANARQVGGDHYRKKIQTWDFIVAQEIGFLEGNAIKYIARHKDKGGKEDLEKAIHYLQKAIEVYYP